MYLRNLSLSNFRNYDTTTLSFNEKVNGIVGPNGSGKTTLLDAIYYLSCCRSCFFAHDFYSIRFGTDFFAIHGEFADEESQDSVKVSCAYRQNGRKTMKADNREYARLSDHIGLFPVVMVSPYDSDIINEGSELRRKFFDMMISQFDKEYLHQLITYKKLLQQRNVLLKQFLENRHSDDTLLRIIDEQMILSGSVLFDRRRWLTNQIVPIFRQHYHRLVPYDEVPDIQYQSALLTIPYAQGLQESACADAQSGYTNFGIHRDDFAFLLNERPVKKYGSQGQQKSFLLALKLSQFDYVVKQKNKKPILLLDDIFDKLDKSRIMQLLDLVGQEHFGQVFITDTDEQRVRHILNEYGIVHDIIAMNR